MGTRLLRSLLQQRHDLTICLQNGERRRFLAHSAGSRPDPPSSRHAPASSNTWRFLATAGAGAAAAALFLGGRSESDAPRTWPLQSREPSLVLPGAAGDGAVVSASSELQQLTGASQPSWAATFAASQPLQARTPHYAQNTSTTTCIALEQWRSGPCNTASGLVQAASRHFVCLQTAS